MGTVGVALFLACVILNMSLLIPFYVGLSGISSFPFTFSTHLSFSTTFNSCFHST